MAKQDTTTKKTIRIPELTQTVDAMWADQELAKADLEPERKATLEKLQKKALARKLTARELNEVQQRSNKANSNKATKKCSPRCGPFAIVASAMTSRPSCSPRSTARSALRRTTWRLRRPA